MKSAREFLSGALTNAASKIAPDPKNLEEKNDPLLEDKTDYVPKENKSEDAPENSDDEITKANSRHKQSSEKSIVDELNEGLSKLNGGLGEELTISKFQEFKKNPSSIKDSLLLPEAKNYRSAPSSPRKHGHSSAASEEGVSNSVPNSPRGDKKLAIPSSKTKTAQSAPNSPKEGSKIFSSPRGSLIKFKTKTEEAKAKLEAAKKSLIHKKREEPKSHIHTEKDKAKDKDRDAEIGKVRNILKNKLNEKLETKHNEAKNQLTTEIREIRQAKNSKKYKEENKKSRSEIRSPTEDKRSKNIEESPSEIKPKLINFGKVGIHILGGKKNSVDNVPKKELKEEKSLVDNVSKKESEEDRESTMEFSDIVDNVPKKEPEEHEPTTEFSNISDIVTPGAYHIIPLKEKSNREFLDDLGEDIMNTELDADEKDISTKDASSQQLAEVKETKEEINDEKESAPTTNGEAVSAKDIVLPQPVEVKDSKEEITYGEKEKLNPQDVKVERHEEDIISLNKPKDSAIQHEQMKALEEEMSHENNDTQSFEDAVSSLKPTSIVPKDIKKEDKFITNDPDKIAWKNNFDKVYNKVSDKVPNITKSQVIRSKKTELKETSSDAAKEIARLKETDLNAAKKIAKLEEIVITHTEDIESTNMGSVNELTAD